MRCVALKVLDAFGVACVGFGECVVVVAVGEGYLAADEVGYPCDVGCGGLSGFG